VPHLGISLPQKQDNSAKTMQRKRKKFAMNTNHYVINKTFFNLPNQ